MKKVILASGNAGKLKEMSALLSPLGWTVAAQSQFFAEEAEETGLSFIENALLKARFAAQKTGLPAIADDSGLEVLALNGQPGIYSARYAQDWPGNASQDAKNNAKLLKNLEQEKNRQACYYCAMVYVRHAQDPTPLIGLGKWCGEVLRAEQGEGGFGYDPLIWIPSLQKTVAEISAEQKNKISHRAQAMAALLSQL